MRTAPTTPSPRSAGYAARAVGHRPGADGLTLPLHRKSSAKRPQNSVIPAPTPAPAPAPMPEVVTPAPAPIAEQAQDLIVAQLGLAGRRGLAGEFFMFFDMLNNLLSEAERTGRGGMLRDMLGNLTQATPAVREGFKDCAKHILELEESAMLPENNRINIIWRIFAPCVQENKHQIITNYIQRIYVSQPQYLAGVENLEALLAKFEQEMPADVQATWTTLQPIHKLFYIQFLRFFFAAQEVIARA